ncbi:hypothetical protein [Pedobacter endophyticus]|uniref:Uncharacterized protein n=1 Tax=Pedobacter endophyticus TaxID=2789740 RepID=A0A7S9Q0R9_9SPHI|nr:hypothetical protein [Pedobacter endophyticus]QPH41002.1 hypothetical protein IZT61_07015 [Pedobacter endophyticus]
MEMQHFLIYLLVFLCGVLAYYLAQRLLNSLNKNESKRPPKTMDAAVIRQMVANYRSNHLSAISKVLGIEDAQSVSFCLKTLKNFIADIEFYTKKVNPRITESALGIRFYYAAYPKEEQLKNLESEKLIGKNYAEKHTLVMIPTLKIKNANGNFLDYDFNPLDSSTYTRNERNLDQPIQMMAMTSNEDQSREVMAQNHGQLIPPAQIDQQSY